TRAGDPLRASGARLRAEPRHLQPAQSVARRGPEPARRPGAAARLARLGAARRAQPRAARRRAVGAGRGRRSPAAPRQGKHRLAPRARRARRGAAEGGRGAVSAVAQAGEHRIGRRAVAVAPSAAGVLLGAALLAMLIAALNYQLTLGYALTFLIAGVAVVGALHTMRNLAMLTLRGARADPVFAGQLAEFTLIARNETRFERFALALHAPGMAQPEHFDVPAGAEQFVPVALPTRDRKSVV